MDTRQGRARVVSGLCAALVGAGAAIGLVACGNDDSVSQEELQQATREAAQQARQDAELDALRRKVEQMQGDQQGNGGDVTTTTTPTTGGSTVTTTTGGGAGVPADAENCGAGVYAAAGTTSCAFALNVASDYYSSPSSSFNSYSPSTGQTYRITCSGSAPVVCTGGNNAAVYIP